MSYRVAAKPVFRRVCHRRDSPYFAGSVKPGVLAVQAGARLASAPTSDPSGASVRHASPRGRCWVELGHNTIGMPINCFSALTGEDALSESSWRCSGMRCLLNGASSKGIPCEKKRNVAIVQCASYLWQKRAIQRKSPITKGHQRQCDGKRNIVENIGTRCDPSRISHP